MMINPIRHESGIRIRAVKSTNGSKKVPNDMAVTRKDGSKTLAKMNTDTAIIGVLDPKALSLVYNEYSKKLELQTTVHLALQIFMNSKIV